MLNSIWTTKDRPESLYKSMSSFIEYYQKCDRNLNYFVFDDSKSSSAKSITNKLSVPIKYVGTKEKEVLSSFLIDRLGKDFKSIIDYAVLGTIPGFEDVEMSRLGANRNCAQLFTIDSIYVSHDDDVFADIYKHPDSKNKLLITNEYRRKNIHYRNEQEVLSSFNLVDVDILSEHEMLLGKTIYEIDLNNESEVFINRDAKILATSSGFLGDMATLYPRSLCLDIDDDDIDKYNEQEYNEFVLCRDTSRVFKKYRVTKHPMFFMPHVCFDNTEYLPPFHSIMRNSDDIFALLYLKENTCIGHVPSAIYHKPLEERKFTRNHFVKKFRWQLLLRRTIETTNDVSHHLFELSRLTTEQFIEYLMYYETKDRLMMLKNVERRLSEVKNPFLIKDLLTTKQDLEKQIVFGDDFFSVDFKSPKEKAVQLLQLDLAMFSVLIRIWPTVRFNAREFKG